MFDEQLTHMMILGNKYEIISHNQRILNGIREYLLTAGVVLVILSAIFTYYLEDRSSVADLEEYSLVESIQELHPAILMIRRYLSAIVLSLLLIPLAIFALVYRIDKMEQTKSSLTERLLSCREREEIIVPSVEASE